MVIVFRLIKEVDGKEVDSLPVSMNDFGLIVTGIIYAKQKDYHKPRIDSYQVIIDKIKDFTRGV